MLQEEVLQCEVRYSTLEIDGFSKPLLMEYYFINGKPGRPFDLPTCVGRDPDTNDVVFRAWQDETGKYHRKFSEGDFRPAYIIDGKQPRCEWFNRGKVIKIAYPVDGYIEPHTDRQVFIYDEEQARLIPNWNVHLEIP